jgi:DNA-binding transcriptional ArsR family regulator
MRSKRRDGKTLLVSAILVVLIALLALTSLSIVSQRLRIVYVVYDSCGFEVARDLIKRYPELRGVILYPEQELNEPVDLAVFLGLNITTRLSEIARNSLDKFSSRTIYTDFLKPDGAIPTSDLWRYCIDEDEEALDRIAEIIIKNISVKSQPQINLPLHPLVPVLVATVVATISISQWDRLKDLTRRIKLPLPLIIPILLRQKIKIDEVLNHPLRKRIYELVYQNGVVPFSEILEIGSKASIEWHTYVLIRSGLVLELKITNGRNKKRYLAINNPDILEKTLPKIDERFKCILENITLDSRVIAEICRLDHQSVIQVLRAIRGVKI